MGERPESLGLATLAGYLDLDDEVILQDEHVETIDLSDEPDLVVIQVYITSAYRVYELADQGPYGSFRQRQSRYAHSLPIDDADGPLQYV
jgi:hypothetical protein